MGGGNWVKELDSVSLTPESALSVENKIEKFKLKITATPEGGRLLGVLQPIWMKAIESDMRLKWLGEMLRRDICVREIQNFGENITNQLRAASSKEEEISREALMSLMEVKHKDERRHYRECIKIRECIRDWVRKQFGRGRVKTLFSKLKSRETKRKRELKLKYKEKTEHLERERELELLEKLEIVPEGLEEFSECDIFHKDKMENYVKEKIEIKTIGEIKIDEEEKSILELNPKFAVMKKIKTIEMEHDVEYCLGKLRYEIRKIEEMIKQVELEETEYGFGSQSKKRRIENTLTPEEEEAENIEDAKIRQIYDPITKKFNYSNRRVTDLPENNRVMLPKEVSPKLEHELGMFEVQRENRTPRKRKRIRTTRETRDCARRFRGILRM